MQVYGRCLAARVLFAQFARKLTCTPLWLSVVFVNVLAHLTRYPAAMVGVVLLAVGLGTGVRAGLSDLTAGQLSFAEKKWGREAPPRLQVWQRVMRDGKGMLTAANRNEAQALRTVNGFFNQVPYFTDRDLWRADDYWATPLEMLSIFGGDCEDYSIGKYLSLKEAGIPVEKLRITYVRITTVGEAHMVLAYYPTPDAEPLILDNYNGTVLPASQRKDLEPVYSFNDDDLWFVGAAQQKGGASSVRQWRELLEKLAREQKL